MVMIRTYTLCRKIFRDLGESGAPEIEELRLGALAITEAVLYVKQHSVNCISAAMYAMTRFDPGLFPREEAEIFTGELFRRDLNEKDGEEIRAHILGLYRRFLEEGENASDWREPLFRFLKSCPRKI
jgi:hypothetical protein